MSYYDQVLYENEDTVRAFLRNFCALMIYMEANRRPESNV